MLPSSDYRRIKWGTEIMTEMKLREIFLNRAHFVTEYYVTDMEWQEFFVKGLW